MSLLYNFGIQLYHLSILVASIFNKKASLMIKGRKGLLNNIKSQINKNDNIIWFHCASLGEFEQGRPLIENIKKKYPDKKILLTFFSPSAYEIRKNYSQADYIFYLPFDTKNNAKKFIKIVNPKIAIFVKYEYWFNYISELKKNNVPLFFTSSIFNKNKYFFKWYGSWSRKNLKKISGFFVQNQESKKLLESIGISNVVVSGDTRFDRVYKLSQNCERNLLIEKFVSDKRVFIAGSTWPPDDVLIVDLINSGFDNIKFIIAPHEINDNKIENLIKSLKPKTLKYSDANLQNIQYADVLIIDCIGILSKLYQYSSIAYIGGGFGVSIHNIQEPATFGNTVIFGTNYKGFQEAVDLVDLGGAFPVENSRQLISKTKKLLSDKKFLKTSSDICLNYIKKKTGATELILSKLEDINAFDF